MCSMFVLKDQIQRDILLSYGGVFDESDSSSTCQEILAAHGGQVTVESVEGEGTTFILTLPRAVDEVGETG